MSYPLDPEVAAVLAYAPNLDLTNIAAARAGLAAATAGLPPFQPADDVELLTVGASSTAGPSVDLHILRPVGPVRPRPAILWFHGGGFVLGQAGESLPFLQAIVQASGAIAISVEYTLAPEATHPTPLVEGRAALDWVIGQAETLGVDTGWIAVGGQSAGGAHAAALAQLVRDDGGPRFAFQLLDIPVTDDTVSTDSASQYADTAVWTTECARLSWDAYLGSRDPGAHPAASAARARDLSGLPPAFITVGQFDPLRDEGIEYARRLAHAGVPTELHMYPGTFHGSSGIAVTAAVSIRQNNDLVAAFCRAAATHTKGESA